MAEEEESLSIEEINAEILECARYGESDELREYIKQGGDCNYCDDNGNTALHKAAANGEVECIKVLKELDAKHVQNKQGNFPIHWAAQNGKTEAVKFLLESYLDIDVLIQNSFGRSTLTEGFQSKNTDVIELILSHSSATEEKLMATSPSAAVDSVEEKPTDITDDNNSRSSNVNTDENDNSSNSKIGEKQQQPSSYDIEKHAVFHYMLFDTPVESSGSNNSNSTSHQQRPSLLRIRELPITRADHPFGSETCPDDDTTGLGIWPASILAARWVVHNKELLKSKVVVELGAGCGLPGLAAALYCSPCEVHITDIHKPTLRNAVFNVQLNNAKTNVDGGDNDCFETNESILLTSSSSSSSSSSSHTSTNSSNTTISNTHASAAAAVSVKYVNWGDATTYPVALHSADVIIGSDLVYDENILQVLVPALQQMLKIGGHFLYVAPIEGRSGMDALESALSSSTAAAAASMECVYKELASKEFFANPLVRTSQVGSTTTVTTAAAAMADSKQKVSASSNKVDDSFNNSSSCSTVVDSSIPKEKSNNNKQLSEKEGTNEEEDEDYEGRVMDDYILHFYDLSIQKPHYLYHFVKVR